MKAFILSLFGVNVRLKDVLNRIRRYDVVEESYLIYGNYDMITKVKINNLRELANFITHCCEEGVAGTSSFIVNESHMTYESRKCKGAKKSAYIFLRARGTMDFSAIKERLIDNNYVCEGHTLFGIYDMVVSASEKTRKDIFGNVNATMRNIPGIISTDTFITLPNV